MCYLCATQNVFIYVNNYVIITLLCYIGYYADI